MNTFLSGLDWRFATKKFDSEKKVSDEHLAKILQAIQQVPTSYGLQTFHVDVVSNDDFRAKMKDVSYGQSQVTEASHILIFSARNDVSERITHMLDEMSGGDTSGRDSFAEYEQMMRGSIEGKTSEDLMNWASRQAYLALGFGLAACAELRIDSCPMEGFDNKAVHELLGSPENSFPFAYLSIGYRKEGPAHPKFRFSQDDLFTFRG